MDLKSKISSVTTKILSQPITRSSKDTLTLHKEEGLLGTEDHIGTVGFEVNRTGYIHTARGAGLYIGWDFMNCFNRSYKDYMTSISLSHDIHGVLQYITINNYFDILEAMPFESHYIDFLLRYKKDILDIHSGNKYVTMMGFFMQREEEKIDGIIPRALTALNHSNIVFADISEHYEDGYVNVLPDAQFFDIKLSAHVTQGFGSRQKFEYFKGNFTKYHHWFETSELTAKEYMDSRLNMAFTLLYALETAFIMPALPAMTDLKNAFLLENYRPSHKQVYRLFSNNGDKDKYGTIYFKNRHDNDYIIVDKIDKSIG